jgi:GntR family transcriptional regulator
MQFVLNKNQKSTLYEQAREQLITALHMGTLRSGDRLPSVRQLAQRNNLNIKTAFAIYQRLKGEGYLEIRTGSGAYVSDIERMDLDQAYCLSIIHLIKSNLAQANQLKIEPRQYSGMVQSFIDKSPLHTIQVAVIECNKEQINLFASEMSERLKVCVTPVILSDLENPDPGLSTALAQMDYFVTTDFHYNQVKEFGAGYKKKILQVRLNPDFVPTLIDATRRGLLLMIVSEVSFFPAFCRNMEKIGISPALLERISAVDDNDFTRLREAIAPVQSVYISPICDPRVRQFIPAGVQEVKMKSSLSDESIETLEAVMLFHNQKN